MSGSRDLLRATAVTSLATLVSRVLGMVRDIVVAGLFGMGAGADAFLIAFRIPNFLRRLFAEGAFSQAFVPVLGEYRERRSAEVGDLIEHVAGTLTLVLAVIVAIGVVAAPIVVLVIAPGFHGDADKAALTASMLRITFPYILFISLAALGSAVLNSHGRFGAPALTPVWLNLALIGCAVWLAPHLSVPITGLAWGVFLGGVAQLLWQWPFLRGIDIAPMLRISRHHAGVKRVIRLMIPTLFAVSISQVNLLLDTLLASFLETGSVSWLYFSDRLLEFPLGVFGVALATVMLPALSRTHARGDADAFSHMLDWALRWVLLVGLPAAIALIAIGRPLLTTLFHYGATTDRDILMSSHSLWAYAPGLVSAMAVKILSPGFFARQDTRTPVRIAVYALVANMILNLLLMGPLGHAGLALATTLSSMLNGLLLWWALHSAGVYRASPGWGRFALQVTVATAVMAVAILVLAGPSASWLAMGGLERAMRTMGCVFTGLICYASPLLALGFRPAQLRRPRVG